MTTDNGSVTFPPLSFPEPNPPRQEEAVSEAKADEPSPFKKIGRSRAAKKELTPEQLDKRREYHRQYTRKQRERKNIAKGSVPKTRDPITDAPLVTKREEQLETYNAHRLRVESQKRVPKVLEALDHIINFGHIDADIRRKERERLYKHFYLLDYNHPLYHYKAEILDEISSLEEVVPEEIATVAQILKASEMILERAADRPAIAQPDDESKIKHYAVLDKAPLPTDG